MLTHLSRWAPLTGVAAVLLGVAGAVIQVLANPPGSDASGAQVIAFYEAHRAGEQVASILLTFVFIFWCSLPVPYGRTCEMPRGWRRSAPSYVSWSSAIRLNRPLTVPA